MGATKPPPERKRPQLFDYPSLPSLEVKVCFTVMISTMCYAWYCVYEASNRLEWKMGMHGAINEIPFIGPRMKDQTNWEWWRWSPLAQSYLPIYFGHFIFFNLGSHFLSEKVFPPVYTVLSIIASAYHYSPWLAFCSIAQGTVIFATSRLVRSKMAVWLSALPILYYIMHKTDSLHQEVFLVLLFVSYTLLSYISYCLETSEGQVRKEDDTILKQYIRMMYYAFYQPYLVSLIVIYPEFERQIEERKTKKRDWKDAIFYGVRICFFWALMEFALHFLYFEAILKDMVYANSLPKDTFVSLGMALGMFFHLKYVIIFGLPTVFAKLDNMQPMDGPICLVGVVLYSKVWRSFDRGLYQFFKKYIFIPICQPTFSLQRKIFGVFVSYGFVLLWHGFYHHNIVWIGLNIAALLMEMSSKALYTVDAVREFRERTISDRNFRRVLGWLQIVPFAFGLYSNFYFLGGSAVGQAFVKRIYEEETVTLRWPFWLLITLGYFYVQTTMEVDLWKSEKEKNKLKQKQKTK